MQHNESIGTVTSTIQCPSQNGDMVLDKLEGVLPSRRVSCGQPKSAASSHARRHLGWFSKSGARWRHQVRSRARPSESEEENPGAREGCRESVLQNQHGCGTVSAVRIRVSTFSAIWHDRGPLGGPVPARARRRTPHPRDHDVPSTQRRRRASEKRRQRAPRARGLLSIAAAPLGGAAMLRFSYRGAWLSSLRGSRLLRVFFGAPLRLACARACDACRHASASCRVLVVWKCALL
ncbi:hypothetical protein MTO96_007499 [Rhipicephalus appendiculatus]